MGHTGVDVSTALIFDRNFPYAAEDSFQKAKLLWSKRRDFCQKNNFPTETNDQLDFPVTP